ncbi:MAG: phytanoyl-CoA dioxygenase family protein [candidate division Zixibacteria bacterium]|nr:phytanoyl-CoA dioxygenase family protein [candidate division Zixibacteria bacterium]
MLTEDQIHQFRVFGFIVLRQVFDTGEIEKLGRLADEIWTAELGHTPEGEEQVSTAPFLELRSATLPLIEDDRLYTPMTQLLGQDMMWMGSEGVRGTMTRRPHHHWHADRPGPSELGYLRIKIMMYLDPMRKDAGAFRVIPGSHRSPFHEELTPFQQRHGLDDPAFFSSTGSEVPCHPVETDPGDAVIFNQSLYHAVYGKAGRRRYIALKYACRPTSDAHLASIMQYSPDALKPHERVLRSDSPRLRAMTAGVGDLRARAEAL